jgi:hypothetical protein
VKGSLLSAILLISPVVWSAPYESKIKNIDRATMALDGEMSNLVLSDSEDCHPERCVKIWTYRDSTGRIVKTIEEVRSQDEPGSITSRYYKDCKLILSRVAPLDPEAAKDPKNISKFYFHDGKLLRITYGGEIHTFSPEQTGYYSRTQNIPAVNCQSK